MLHYLAYHQSPRPFPVWQHKVVIALSPLCIFHMCHIVNHTTDMIDLAALEVPGLMLTLIQGLARLRTNLRV